MSKVILFGTGQFSDVAYWYLHHESAHTVAAFTVEDEYTEGRESHNGHPLIPWSTIQDAFSPSDYQMLVFFSYIRMNAARRRLYEEAKRKGYQCLSYISPHARCNAGFVGENVFIMEDNVVQPHVFISDNTILWSGNHVGHHTFIGSHVFIASHVVVSGSVNVGEHCFLGVNSTIRDNITIAPHSLIGAGATILHDTKPHGVYPGHESKRIDGLLSEDVHI